VPRAVTNSVHNHTVMLGPFSHYLQSNRAPSEDEACEIKALTVNPLKEISIIDVEIDQIEGILNSLKQKRARFQNSVDDCNTILAPVRRLSVDVLGVIFCHCLVTHRNPIMSSSEAPILLTHICHDWRSIALSIPRLWSRFYIPLLHSVLHYRPETLSTILERERRTEARSEEVQRWLKLSAACPLSITMMPTGDPTSHPPLLDAIIQSSRRWQQLELGFLSPDSDVSNRLLSLSADDLSMLRELRLHSLQSSTISLHTEDLWYQSGLLAAKGLRSIFIADIHQTNAFPVGIPPNWKNLHHLFIHSPILLGLANQILSCCSNLVACLLEIAAQWDGIDPTPNDTITSLPPLPHLIFLSLQGDITGCNQLASNIQAPSLRILDYQGYFPIEDEDFGLLSLLQSINTLETLRVDHHNLSINNALKYYTLVPSVTHLVLGRSPKRRYRYFPSHYAHPEHGNLINTLYEVKHQYSPDSVPTVLFPSLEVFEAYDISSVPDTILLKFIMERIDAARSNTGVSKLRKVVVEFSRTRQTDIAPQVSDYARAAGIDFELDLTYHTGKELDVTLSPSFGLSMDDVSWIYPLYDY
jgi:hypothetical protein